MLRARQIVHFLKTVERNFITSLFGIPPKDFSAVVTTVQCPTTSATSRKFTLEDLIGDGLLLAVPKFRRTVEKRWKRKFGSPDYVWKMLVPKKNIIVCHECGHNHESGRLCENCYKRVQTETTLIQDKIIQELGKNPIDKDVVVLYEGESIPEERKQFWKGKRIVEMKKERPQWFSKNLLQKSTQEPSESKDVKPKELA